MINIYSILILLSLLFLTLNFFFGIYQKKLMNEVSFYFTRNLPRLGDMKKYDTNPKIIASILIEDTNKKDEVQ